VPGRRTASLQPYAAQPFDGLGDRAHRREQVAPHVEPDGRSRTAKDGDCLVTRRQGLASGRQESLTLFGQPYAALAFEQPDRQQGLQAGDTFGQRLLTGAQLPGGASEMQVLGGNGERPHQRQVEIHGPDLKVTTNRCDHWA
jgi:hypothetical protein